MKKQSVKLLTLLLSVALCMGALLPLAASVCGTVRLAGDVDGDGQLLAADARLTLRAAVGLENYELGSPEFIAADTDGNGTIEASDARNILRAAVGLEPIGGEAPIDEGKDTFQVGDYILHYGKYYSDDGKSSFQLNKDGTLIFESVNGNNYTGSWQVRKSEYDGWALYLTDANNTEKTYWAGGNDCFDTAFRATMTYWYSPNGKNVKEYQKFLFEQSSGLSINPEKEKSDSARGLYYPTVRFGGMISDGEWIYALTGIQNGETPEQCLYRSKCSGGKPEKLGDWQISDMMVHNGWIYAVVCTDGMNCLMRISTDGKTSGVLMPAFEKTDYSILDVTDTSVYFERKAAAENGIINTARRAFSRYYRMNLDGSGIELLPLDYEMFDNLDADNTDGSITVRMSNGYLYHHKIKEHDLFRVRVDGKNMQTIYTDSCSFWCVYQDTTYILCRDRDKGESKILKVTPGGGTETIVTHKGLLNNFDGYYNGVVYGYDLSAGKLAEQKLPKNYWTEGAYEAEGWLRQTNCKVKGDALMIDIHNRRGYYISPKDGIRDFDHNYQLK